MAEDIGKRPDRAAEVMGALAALGVHGRRLERPANEKEAQAILAQAHRDRKTVLPCGGGTSMGSGTLPEAVDIVLDTTGLDRMLSFDSQNLNMAVLGGMTVDAINAQLAGEGRGFFLPLDPPQAGRATIGGVYASNGSGPRRLLYGTVRDQALGVRGADAQGREVGFGGKTVKNVSGYDLTKFFIGSGGSLGLITSISLRIMPLPEASSLCEVRFEEAAGLDRFLSALRASVLVPSAVVVTEGAAGGNGALRVLVGFEGDGVAVARENRDLLQMAGTCGGSGEATEGRDALNEALRSAQEPAGFPDDYVHIKVCVPLSQGPKAYDALRGLLRQHPLGFWKAILCAGSGVLTLYASGLEGDGARRLAEGARQLASAAGGHAAPVRATRAFLEAWGPRAEPGLERWVLQPLKRQLDPAGVFPAIL